MRPTHRTVLSQEPDTMVLPSELMATLATALVCPSSTLFCWPVNASHTLGEWDGFGAESQTLECANRQMTAHAPNSPHGPVTRAGHDGLAVGADGHAVDVAGVPLQHALLLAGQSVPHAGMSGMVLEHKVKCLNA